MTPQAEFGKPQMLDVVELLVDLPEEGLARGETGTIILVFDRPYVAYEVEFVNDDGTTQATCTLRPDQVRVVWRLD